MEVSGVYAAPYANVGIGLAAVAFLGSVTLAMRAAPTSGDMLQTENNQRFARTIHPVNRRSGGCWIHPLMSQTVGSRCSTDRSSVAG